MNVAGSYSHCVTEDGKLRRESFPDLIENLGDAYEAVEQMYGMIWLLAIDADHVEWARQNYETGLEISPGIEEE